MTLGEKIYKLRKQHGLSQEQLASKLGVSRQTVSKWEMGTSPDLDNVVKIADFFACSLDYLMRADRTEINGDEGKTDMKKQAFSLAESWQIKLATTLPILVLVVLWIISKILTFPISHQDAETGNFYIGFAGFIDYFSLSTIVYLCFAIGLTSLVLQAVWQVYIQPYETGVRLGKKFLYVYLVRFVLLVAGSVLLIYRCLTPGVFYWTLPIFFIVVSYFITLGLLSLAINYLAEKESGCTIK